jgi:hypothetical protein
MRSEVFVYLDIYLVYIEIYDYGVFIHGVRFPDARSTTLRRQGLAKINRRF